MTLPSLRPLGRSGLLVSPLTLGTMTMADPRWGSDEVTSADVLDRYLASGGNAVDTADVYAGGAGEELLGRLIEERKIRHELVIATKYGLAGGDRSIGGSGRVNLAQALEGSLRRLRVEHIDLYWLHRWDGVTPAEELVRAMDAQVGAGKIRYWGLSNVPAWFAAQVATLAATGGCAGPVALQLEYSLVARGVEREHLPAARALGLSLVPWSPLAGGFLTGKYRRVDQRIDQEGRLISPDPSNPTPFTDDNWRALDVVRRVAARLERTPADVALAWLLAQPQVDTVLVGARTADQLEAAEAAVGHGLPAEELELLEAEIPGGAGDGTDPFGPATRARLIGGGRLIDERPT